MKYISIIMSSFSVIMCFVLAYYLTFTDLISDRLEGTARIVLIAILLVYAGMRIFRIMKQVKKIKL